MLISPNRRPVLIVMVKAAVAGRVKTRLGQDIGMTEAAWWYRHQVARLLRRIKDRRWDTVLAVSPGHTMRGWPPHLPQIGQGTGDLGDRMGRLLRSAPPGPVTLIGADIPKIDRSEIARAFTALGDADAVFGPAVDGGYWLVGLRRVRAVPAGLFQGVRWSSAHALADTKATLPGHRIAHVSTLRDVDSATDLVALGERQCFAHDAPCGPVLGRAHDPVTLQRRDPGLDLRESGQELKARYREGVLNQGSVAD